MSTENSRPTSLTQNQWNRLNDIGKEEAELLKKLQEIGERLTKLSVEKNTILSLQFVSSRNAENGKLTVDSGTKISSRSSDDLFKKKEKRKKREN